MASANDALSTEELEFEIQVQHTVVISLEDGPQDDDTPAAIHEAKQQLKNLRQTLKTRIAREKGTHPFLRISCWHVCRSFNALTLLTLNSSRETLQRHEHKLQWQWQ